MCHAVPLGEVFSMVRAKTINPQLYTLNPAHCAQPVQGWKPQTLNVEIFLLCENQHIKETLRAFPVASVFPGLCKRNLWAPCHLRPLHAQEASSTHVLEQIHKL